MQDSAKSVWKASKQFASSVVTGGVGLSSCRQCTSKRGSVSTNKRQQQQQQVKGGVSLTSQQQRDNEQQQRDEFVIRAENSASFEKCSLNNNDTTNKVAGVSCDDGEQHTSVIEVGPTKATNAATEHASDSRQIQQPQQRQDEQSGGGLIRVDGNNKLTIVTKFNDSDCSTGPNTSIEIGAPTSSGSGSERSRCESSSSGRGTSSDAGSSASQNGDLDGCSSSVVVVADKRQQQEQVKNNDKHDNAKRHKRKSSLFKANKIFGGSQASLNKFKNFFMSSSNVVKVTSSEELKHYQQQQQQQDNLNEHLERSRLRCMELNNQTATSHKTMTLKTSDQSIGVNDVKTSSFEVSSEKLGNCNGNSSNENNNNNNISESQDMIIKGESALKLGQGSCEQVEVNHRIDKSEALEQYKSAPNQQQVAGGGVLIVGSS